MSAKSITPNEAVKVKVDVTNTGKIPGKEIVQLYVRDVKSTFARPEKELKAFEKVELKPRQTKTITFTLDREAFWYFDSVKDAWSTEAGEFEILVGASSRDIRLNGFVTLAPEGRASRFHTGLTVGTLLDHPQSRAFVTKYAGGFLLMEDMSMAMDMTLEQVAYNHPNHISQETLAKIAKDLAGIK
jgi:beta-glucosidase